tara:strand:+ start:169 stop:381 length:213 start_codon:yes stop_codon:yes gene_type:complete
MKISAEIVNGVCPTCEEYTPLVSLTPETYRCMTCGTDLKQHINGKISYIPQISSNTLTSEVQKYFDGQES